ncbi:lysozyme [Colwellia phage 9A]|uniref:Lysozyme n=1 Tax=Colwellia phage 9A TaxID=765765 RepID=I3UMC3_9CAUD|nr:lysozyme [Colwellia phage 9A]AFK66638.1 lysozyme [Colwellia phage 9A]
MITIDQYKKEERKQTIHRSINTALSVVIVVFGFFFIKAQVTPMYEQLTGITEQKQINKMIYSEIVQINADEGYRRCVYNDTEGYPTVGWGHKLLPHEKFKCIDPTYAVALLRKDYEYAKRDVKSRYPWANDDLQLVLINMTFNMGAIGLSKFEDTLAFLKAEEYDLAAGELLDSKYARKLPRRASSMAVRIMRLQQ